MRGLPCEIGNILPRLVKLRFEELKLQNEYLQEIRMRINQDVGYVYQNKDNYLSDCIIKSEHIKECLDYISRYSLYAFEDEIRQGFITIQGGHRVGIAGKAILREGKIHNMKNISFINIRIAHEVIGCADDIMPYIVSHHEVLPTLLISPPRCGKTTLLRDMIRQISNEITNVGVVDERSEIGGCCLGVPQNDLGKRTDVLDCCPKAQGMMMLIRSMAPSVVAVDEIGTREDMEALNYVMNCGCVVIATAHGYNMDDIRQKPVLSQMVKEHAFRRYIVLEKGGQVGKLGQIYDERGNLLYNGQ